MTPTSARWRTRRPWPSRRDTSPTRWPAARACSAAAAATPRGRLFFEPTVLADVPADARIMRGETFGLVAALAPFDAEEEAVARANDTEFGLVAYLHTGCAERARRVTRALEFGMVAVNRTRITGAPIPFGGVKGSGLGREGSRLGLEAFTEVKYVCCERF